MVRPLAPVALTLVSLALACRRTADRPPARERAPSTAVAQEPVAPPGGDERQAIPDGYCHPAVVVATGRGGAIIDACFDPSSGQTDLIGQRLDADAMAVGSRVRLRRIAGSVVSLAATSVDGAPRVAWIAHEGEGAERSDESDDRSGGTRDIAVLALDAELAPQGDPVRAHRFRVEARPDAERRGWARSRVELAPGPGHALLVLATDAEEPCPSGGQRCATWSIFSVEGQESRRVRHESTASPSYAPQSLVHVGEDLAYVRGADAVRSTLYVHSMRAGGAALSAMPAAIFDPLPDWTSGSLGWTGTAMVTLGEERTPDRAEGRAVVRVTAVSGPAPMRPRDDGDALRWPPVTARTWRCVRGHPVVRIAWRGGSVDLDPTAAGASFELSRFVTPSLADIPARGGLPGWTPPMAWTGRALLAIDGNDHLRRWTCGRDGDPPFE